MGGLRRWLGAGYSGSLICLFITYMPESLEMRRYLEERALRLAYRLLYFVRRDAGLRDINLDAKLDGAQRYIAEVVTQNYGLRQVP